ncbi:MAG: dienelactone hydrolase family protein [Chloroflexota bacterium]
MPQELPTDIQHITTGPAFEALGLAHRVRIPSGEGLHPTLVMVHGLQGNEDVTWVFARTVPPDWLIISPRAPFAATAGGYEWSDSESPERNTLTSLEAGNAALTRFIDHLPNVYPVDPSRLVLLGFSQGAAMSYLFATSHSVSGVAALGGFIPPQLVSQLHPLNHLPILILHGTRDETISIETARRNRDQLIAAGADVTYQESDIGHKVSSAGMAALKEWLKARHTD